MRLAAPRPPDSKEILGTSTRRTSPGVRSRSEAVLLGSRVLRILLPMPLHAVRAHHAPMEQEYGTRVEPFTGFFVADRAMAADRSRERLHTQGLGICGGEAGRV